MVSVAELWGKGGGMRKEFKLEPERKGARYTQLWTLNVWIRPMKLVSD